MPTVFRPALRLQHTTLLSTPLPPAFLLPAFYPRPSPHSSSINSTHSFHTSAPLSKRRPPNGNRRRGLSPLRSTGFRSNRGLTVRLYDLPQPRPEAVVASERQTDPDHGLWRFFRTRDVSLGTPAQLAAHGRSWTEAELGRKSWEDLHQLWWACVYERNMIYTEELERERLRAGYGENEAVERDDAVDATMKAIKSVLENRWYTWEDARALARSERPDITLHPTSRTAYAPAELPQDDDSAAEMGQHFSDNKTMFEAGKDVPSSSRSISGGGGGTAAAGLSDRSTQSPLPVDASAPGSMPEIDLGREAPRR